MLPAETRVYADPLTKYAYEAWTAGASSIARMLTESTRETKAFRETLRKLAGLE